MRTLELNTFVAQVVGDCFVFAHGEASPTDEEWRQLIAFYQAGVSLSRAKTLVSTLGGAPSPKQRAQLNTLFGSVKPRMVVLTNSAVARAAGVAISWFNPEFKIVRFDDVDAALDHLALSIDERQPVRETLNALRQRVRNRPASGAPARAPDSSSAASNAPEKKSNSERA